MLCTKTIHNNMISKHLTDWMKLEFFSDSIWRNHFFCCISYFKNITFNSVKILSFRSYVFQRKKSNLKCKGLVFVILSFILVKFAENFVFAISFVSFVLTWNPSKILLTMYKKFVSKTLNLPQTTRFGQSLIKDNKW